MKLSELLSKNTEWEGVAFRTGEFGVFIQPGWRHMEIMITNAVVSRDPEVPVVPDLERQILIRTSSRDTRLDMSTWNASSWTGCGTAMCLGGWAMHLAREVNDRAVTELESLFRHREAPPALIYLASCGFVPHFYELSNRRAHADLRDRVSGKNSNLWDLASGLNLPKRVPDLG